MSKRYQNCNHLWRCRRCHMQSLWAIWNWYFGWLVCGGPTWRSLTISLLEKPLNGYRHQLKWFYLNSKIANQTIENRFPRGCSLWKHYNQFTNRSIKFANSQLVIENVNIMCVGVFFFSLFSLFYSTQFLSRRFSIFIFNCVRFSCLRAQFIFIFCSAYDLKMSASFDEIIMFIAKPFTTTAKINFLIQRSHKTQHTSKWNLN